MTDIKELALRHAEAAGAKGFHWDGSLYDFVEPFLAAYLAEQEPVGYFHKHQYGDNCAVIENVVDSAKDEEGVFPLYAAPPLPEPAHSDHPMRHYDRTCPACPGAAAPSSEEVREMVERLRKCKTGWGAIKDAAADMIERLAARVPDGCVEKYNELLYAVEEKFPGESRHETALRFIKRGQERILHIGKEKQT